MKELAVKVAAALARMFEGLYLSPYLCPAGVATLGYGATYYEDGTRVQLSDPPITRERAEALLLWMIQTKYLPAVLKLCPVACRQYQAGEPGQRLCRRGHFDERVQGRRPQLTQDLQVIMPRTCRGKETQR